MIFVRADCLAFVQDIEMLTFFLNQNLETPMKGILKVILNFTLRLLQTFIKNKTTCFYSEQ